MEALRLGLRLSFRLRVKRERTEVLYYTPVDSLDLMLTFCL